MKKLLVCGALALMLASCSTKQQAISQLESFSYELRDNSANYNAQEWQRAGEKFVKIRKKISKHEFDYTPEEKTRIGELEGQCARYMATGAKDGLLNKVKGLAGELEGLLRGIFGTE